MIQFRRQHPVLRRTRFMHGRAMSSDGVKDITWYTPQGLEKTSEQWNDQQARCLGVLLNGHANPPMGPDGVALSDDLLFVVLNAHHEIVEFTLPSLPTVTSWSRLLDTTQPSYVEASSALPAGNVFPMAGRAVLVLSGLSSLGVPSESAPPP